MSNQQEYNEKNISALTEKEKVVMNLGMYVGKTDVGGVTQMFYEAVSNVIDEFLQGHASKLKANIYSDEDIISIEDNGRGIPVGFNDHGESTIEKMFQTLHMGGKFDSKAYQTSGGMHGIGSKLLTYISDFLEIEVKRDGNHYKLKFEDGILTEKTHIIGKTEETGTKVTFKPSHQHLEFQKIPYGTLSNILKRQHFLTTNLKYEIKEINKAGEIINSDNYLNTKGLAGFIDYVTADETIKKIGTTININDKICSYEKFQTREAGELKLSIAFQYTNQNKTQITGYTNNIHQPEGGTHVNGLKDLIYNGVKNAISSANIKLPKDVIKDDFLNGIVGIVSVNLSRPTLEGQTKNKLGDLFVQKLISTELKKEVELFLLQNIKSLEKIAGHIKTNTTTRKAIENIEKATLKKVKNPTLDSNSKLSDAESKDRQKCELFIVEGDSAGGGILEMRNSQSQAVYRLKGKPLNSIITETQRIFDNDELKNLIYAIGTSIGKTFDISKLRYRKIFILSDSDVDGGHIQTLLLGFFKKLMPQLFINKTIYRVIPPLFGITESNGKKIYLKDRDSLKKYELKNPGKKYLINRFKGLGEMNPEDLYETCINPKNRITEQILDIDTEENNEFINGILGKDGKFKYDFLKNFENFEEKIRKKNSIVEIKDVAKETMYEYGMYSNQERAIPHLEDGLKPVHKRILFAMNKLGVKSSGKTAKSARIVGETIGKYHPHGDLSVYQAAVKLTQDFYMQNPLIEKYGNFGNVFNFNDFAAPRYTEMKLSNFSEEVLLKNLDEKKQIVSFKPNYDGILLEPEYLPAVLPVILLNPSFGIGFGTSIDLPPHNINEVIDATIGAIKTGDKFDPFKYIKGPDFPVNENQIINSENEIKKVYSENRSFRYRVKLHEDIKTNTISIKSLPYGVEFDTIYKKLLLLTRGEKRITVKGKDKIELLPFNKSLKNEIRKVENFSGKAGKKNGDTINIKITLNKNQDINIVKAKLYKLTELEKSISFRPILINRYKKIKEYGLGEIIREFLIFRRETLTKEFNIEIDKLDRAKLINNAKIIAIDNIDKVIEIIKNSSNDKDAKNKLIEALNINEEQSEYILALQLRYIKKLEKEELVNKTKQLNEEIEKFKELLVLENMNQYIITQLKEYKKKFGNKRNTEIIGKQEEVKICSGILAYEDKDVVIFINSKGMIYKTSGRDIKIENRRTKFKENFGLEREFLCSNREKLYVIQDGKGFSIDIGEIEEDQTKPISLYNQKINPLKEIEIYLTKEDITKNIIVFFEDGNIARSKISDLIKSTQGYKFSKKKITKYLITDEFSDKLERENILQNWYLLRTTSENTIVKHYLGDIPCAKSLGAGIKLRGKTLFAEALYSLREDATKEDLYYINGDKNNILDVNLVEFKDRMRKGNPIDYTIENLVKAENFIDINNSTDGE